MPDNIVACFKCGQRNRLPYTFNRSMAKCGRCSTFLFSPNKTEKEATCLLCESTNGELMFLSNSKAVHKSCVQKEHIVIVENSDEMKKISGMIYQLNVDIRNVKPNYGFLGFIFGDKQADNQAQREIKTLTQEKDRLSRKLSKLTDMAGEDKNRKFLNNKDIHIEEIIKFWPGYPPRQYWVEIIKTVASMHRYRCKDCLKNTELGNGHAHHLVQLKFGGTNEISNLLWLCKKCHQKRHPHNINSKKEIPKINNGFEVRQRKPRTLMQKIDLCLSSGKLLKINYENIKLEKSTRNIRIISIINDKSSGKEKWIKAFCYKRSENRTFKLDRIISANIVD